MVADLRYTSSALGDLDDIWAYTDETWGTEQAERYIAGLERHCMEIARGEAVTRSFGTHETQCRFARYEHHYIFYQSDDASTVILAVLHERMDLIARVRHRLDPR